MRKEDRKEVELLKNIEQRHGKRRQGKESISSRPWMVWFGFQQRLGTEQPKRYLARVREGRRGAGRLSQEDWRQPKQVCKAVPAEESRKPRPWGLRLPQSDEAVNTDDVGSINQFDGLPLPGW